MTHPWRAARISSLMALLLFRSPCDSDDCKIKKGRLLRIKFITTTILAGTVSLFIYVKKFKIITFAEIRLRLQGLCAYLFCYYVCHIDLIYFLANIIAFMDAIFSINMSLWHYFCYIWWFMTAWWLFQMAIELGQQSKVLALCIP
jgi:hypothetical protein